MENLPKEIEEFINEQNVATLCFTDESTLVPYCFSCFYAFDSKKMLLLFKSSRDTFHASNLIGGRPIAGSILPDNLNVLRIQGIQLGGHILSSEDRRHKDAVSVYYKRFPFARVMSGEIWMVQLHTIKLTDNKKGFGKKLKWNLNSNVHEL